jgi:hypothetical protein
VFISNTDILQAPSGAGTDAFTDLSVTPEGACKMSVFEINT